MRDEADLHLPLIYSMDKGVSRESKEKVGPDALAETTGQRD